MGQQRPALVRTLHDVATSIQTKTSVEGVCEYTVAAAANILEFNLCTIVIQDGEWLVPCATSEAAPFEGSRKMRIDEGLAGKTYQTGESYLVGEVTDDDETSPADASYRSGMSVPIGDHGVFQAVDTDPNAFDEGDIELAELLVSHTATALDRLDREEALRQQNERLDQFASLVSHDLRNPLTVASGRLELVADTCESEHLEHVAAAHDRMERLIDDLLLFAQMGADTLSVTTIQVDPLVKTCWEAVASSEGTLTVEEELTVAADRERLRQLFENLLQNALDHAGPAPTISVGPLSDGFYVADDGPGIPAADRETVFEAGHTSAADGTGFGLNIVKQIAAAHDWTVSVTESTSGGARFEFHDVTVETAADR